MVVYWDLAAAWNFTLDYLLLLVTLRLAGRPVRRRRLAAAAALGAAYSVAALTMPFSPWLLAAALAAMCRVAFFHAGNRLRLTLLFLLLACALGGGVLLLGHVSGGMARLAAGVLYARLPWGVFLAAAGGSYLLLAVVFRGGARHRGELLRARVEYGGKSAEMTLLRDTGNALSDPLTGEGVPVIEGAALAPLFGEGTRGAFTTLRCRTVSGGETALRAFRCDALTVEGRALGARLVAVAAQPFGGRYQGLWFDEDREVSERHELEKAVG